MVSKRRTSAYRSGKQDFWVKTKCWEVGTFELWGVKREPGKPVVGIVARDGRYAGSPTISLPKQLRDRLQQLVHKARAEPPAGAPRAIVDPTVEWVKPGNITATVRHLRNEPKLRHGNVQSISEEGT